MSDEYCVNTEPQRISGDHEVHVSTCSDLPSPEHQLPLGWFDRCEPAVVEAKKYYTHVDGCAWCCPECDTG